MWLSWKVTFLVANCFTLPRLALNKQNKRPNVLPAWDALVHGGTSCFSFRHSREQVGTDDVQKWVTRLMHVWSEAAAACRLEIRSLGQKKKKKKWTLKQCVECLIDITPEFYHRVNVCICRISHSRGENRPRAVYFSCALFFPSPPLTRSFDGVKGKSHHRIILIIIKKAHSM